MAPQPSVHPSAPSMHATPRTLCLLFDGTSNEFDDTNTNVVHLCALLKMGDMRRQMVFYQAGIGCYTDPGIRSRTAGNIAKFTDYAVAWYLDEHIMGGYRFLMNQHKPGDKICIFGFSRGAYTARCLAGMLHSVGLLPRDNIEQVPFAYRMYKNQDPLAPAFKTTFCKDVAIDFLGVWDTVASVGAIIPRHLPFSSNSTIKVFRHAISLDEHRTKWDVVLWQPDGEGPKVASSKPKPSVVECWFAGSHSDVGGGIEKDATPHSLSNIPLRWMIHEIQEAKCDVLFDADALLRLGIPDDCVHDANIHIAKESMHTPKVSANGFVRDELLSDGAYKTCEELDIRDATAPLHDPLDDWYMWLLQFPRWLPGRLLPDFSGRRLFPTDERRMGYQKIHPSVLVRKQLIPGYEPAAVLPSNWQKHVSKKHNAGH